MGDLKDAMCETDHHYDYREITGTDRKALIDLKKFAKLEDLVYPISRRGSLSMDIKTRGAHIPIGVLVRTIG